MKTSEELKKARILIKDLDNRLWKLEYPPRFNVGDEVNVTYKEHGIPDCGKSFRGVVVKCKFENNCEPEWVYLIWITKKKELLDWCEYDGDYINIEKHEQRKASKK